MDTVMDLVRDGLNGCTDMPSTCFLSTFMHLFFSILIFSMLLGRRAIILVTLPLACLCVCASVIGNGCLLFVFLYLVLLGNGYTVSKINWAEAPSLMKALLSAQIVLIWAVMTIVMYHCVVVGNGFSGKSVGQVCSTARYMVLAPSCFSKLLHLSLFTAI